MSFDYPEAGYARVGRDFVAFHTLGDGPVDIVYSTGFFSHVDAYWEYPAYEHFLQDLAVDARVIWFDRRGTGASDKVTDRELTWESWAEDLGAVLDAVGSQQAAVFAVTNSGPMALLFAATHPERVSHLILFRSYARITWAEDYPIGVPRDVAEREADERRLGWGTLEQQSSSTTRDRWFSKYQRLSGTPNDFSRLKAATFDVDARSALGAISAPALLLHRPQAPDQRIERLMRYIEEHAPTSTWREVAGSSLVPMEDGDEIVLAVRDFVFGTTSPSGRGRMLATIVFTDVVGSTRTQSAVGDTIWRQQLGRHDRVLAEAVESFGGRVVKSTGDGILAMFEGPARAIHAARHCQRAAREGALEIRAGIHTGEVELIGNDVTGINVTIASRIQDLAAAGEVLVSRTVRDLIAGSEIRLTARGTHDLKGVDDRWELFAVSTNTPGEPRR